MKKLNVVKKQVEKNCKNCGRDDMCYECIGCLKYNYKNWTPKHNNEREGDKNYER